MDALIDAIAAAVTDHGYLAVFLLMLAESAGIPIPSSVTLLAAGAYVSRGQLDVLGVIAAGSIGNLAGAVIAYLVARTLGREALERWGRYVLLRRRDLDRADTWWARRGEPATFVSRLVPVLRTVISFPAGIARMPFGRYVTFTAFGVVAWNATLVTVGVAVGSSWPRVQRSLSIPGVIVLVALAAAAAVFWVRRYRQRAVVASQ